jgi:hypothetical protein
LKLRKHKVAAYRNEDKYHTSAWKDKRLVTMLSTWHNRDTKEVCRKTAKEVEVFQKLAVVIDNTSKMGGVDRADHYCSSYGFLKKKFEMVEKIIFLDFGGLLRE